MQSFLQTDGEPTIRIVTFGAFQIFARKEGTWEQITAQHLHSRGPSLTLLKILLCRGSLMESHRRSSQSGNWEHHAASRDLLIDGIWQEEERAPTDPFTALKVAKSELNRALRPYAGSDVIVRTEGSDGMGYALALHLIEIDADIFEIKVRQASKAEGRGQEAFRLWEAAYSVVQGDFLPYDQYSDWAGERRERVRGKYRLCLHRLAACYLQQGRTSEALELLHPYVLTYPTDSDAISILVPLLAQQGRYEEAWDVMKKCQRLREEEGERPSAAMTALEQRVREAQEQIHLSLVPLVSVQAPTLILQTSEGLILPSLSSQNGVLAPFFSDLQQTSLEEGAPEDWGTWFSERLASIVAFVHHWQWQGSCADFQKMLDRELQVFDEIHVMSNANEYFLSRRNALLLIAALPEGLLAVVQRQQQKTRIEEEFLPACAASLTACWHLLNGKEFASLERALSRYMPILAQWARQPSSYQKAASSLASQGCLLLGLVAHHRMQAQQRVRYTEEAVAYAREADDQVLLVKALTNQGNALYWAGAHDVMLHICQEAEYLVERNAPAFPRVLQGEVLLMLALAYAQQGKPHEALNAISKTRVTFSGEMEAVLPPFLGADGGLWSLILHEGLVRLDLGNSDPKSTHYEQAARVLAQIEELPKTLFVPERIHLQIINHQAQAAIGLGDLEAFHHYTLQSAEGVKVIASERRRQELIVNFKAARKKWPHEARMLELADLLL